MEVRKYTSRVDFLARWSEILEAIKSQFGPSLVIRVGMRYIDRIRNYNFPRIKELIKEVYLGPLFPKFQDQVLHMISETSLSVDEGNLLLRLGKLPNGGTVDPNVLEPANGESFIIDIDVSLTAQKKFEPQELEMTFKKFAERVYTMFRDVVTDEFIKVYSETK